MLITDKHGQVYTVTNSEVSSGLMLFQAAREGVLVARALLNVKRSCVQDALVFSKSDRRRGIATALYNAIEASTNIRLVPSRRRLGDGKAFWVARQRKKKYRALGYMVRISSASAQ